MPAILALLLCLGAAVDAAGQRVTSLVVSVRDQEMLLVEAGKVVRRYPVSTSKFGLGDRQGSYRTPLGVLEVAAKIGRNAPAGAVFKGRQFTGEIIRANASGRDPIVTRILWLRGLQDRNRNAYQRGIYIHGTPVERLIGRPASYGCVRMRSHDVVDLFDRVPVGTRIFITPESTRTAVHRFVGDVPRGWHAS